MFLATLLVWQFPLKLFCSHHTVLPHTPPTPQPFNGCLNQNCNPLRYLANHSLAHIFLSESRKDVLFHHCLIWAEWGEEHVHVWYTFYLVYLKIKCNFIVACFVKIKLKRKNYEVSACIFDVFFCNKDLMLYNNCLLPFQRNAEICKTWTYLNVQESPWVHLLMYV